MKTFSSIISKLVGWIKKRIEGQFLLQWLVYIILFIVLIIFIVDHPSDLPSWRFYGTVLALALMLIINILWIRWEKKDPAKARKPLSLWSFLLTSGVLLFTAVWMGELSNSIFVLFMLCSQATILLGVWPAGLVFCLINMAAWVGVVYLLGADRSTLFTYSASLVIGVLFVSFLSYLLDRFSQQTKRAEALLRELQAANFRLEAASRQEKELAIAEERVRLARDIHDGLGHHLTVLSIQLQAADKLVSRDPQAAVEAIKQSRIEAQSALDEVRQSVSMMRESPAENQPLQEVLSDLVNDYAHRTGLQATFTQSGSPVELSPFTMQTLFRTVQESLTNVTKHAKNVETITVQFDYLYDKVRLVVRDDGQSADDVPDQPPGYGLVGLRERVEQLGGLIQSGPRKPCGFEIELNIPTHESSDDPGSAG
jgi:signal transduction histidine kinase